MKDILADSQRTPKHYAFVVPRYGDNIGGGAETLAGALASKLAGRGDKVEVLTTCARDNRTWENYFPAGPAEVQGVSVERYPVDARNLEVWVPLQIRIADGLLLNVEEQLQWMDQGVNSAALYSCLKRRADEFDAVFFAPYLFSTTFYGSLVRPDKAFLIPCLHDEYYAYVDVIRSMFRQVRGCLFNSIPEQDLANRLYGEIKGAEVGMGFEPWSEAIVQGLRPYFAESFPYLLYVGRKESGKLVQVLIDYFIELKDAGLWPELKLVIVGGGSFDDLHRGSAKIRPDIVDLSQVSEHDKQRLIRHALILCQPSVNESFSIVLMEAWLLGTPVLVNAACLVTRSHVVESGGGLYFSNASDFQAVLQELRTDPNLRSVLAAAGEKYVRQKYNWSAVLERFDGAMLHLESA